ncbi:Uncharacterised protein [Vibrio cholerae]|nr:Uncharacterised protein [Vibrio cholerae]
MIVTRDHDRSPVIPDLFLSFNQLVRIQRPFDASVQPHHPKIAFT